MIRRMWHLFAVGHQWRVASAAWNPATYAVSYEKWRSAGFTHIWLRCDCGASKKRTLYGNHSGVKSSGEINALERMLK